MEGKKNKGNIPCKGTGGIAMKDLFGKQNTNCVTVIPTRQNIPNDALQNSNNGFNQLIDAFSSFFRTIFGQK